MTFAEELCPPTPGGTWRGLDPFCTSARWHFSPMVAGSALKCFFWWFLCNQSCIVGPCVNACPHPPCLRHWMLSLRSTMDCSVVLALLMPWHSEFLSSLDSCRKSRVGPQLRLLSRLCFSPLEPVQLLSTYPLFPSGPKQPLLSSQNEPSKPLAPKGKALKKSWLWGDLSVPFQCLKGARKKDGDRPFSWASCRRTRGNNFKLKGLI